MSCLVLPICDMIVQYSYLDSVANNARGNDEINLGRELKRKREQPASEPEFRLDITD